MPERVTLVGAEEHGALQEGHRSHFRRGGPVRTSSPAQGLHLESCGMTCYASRESHFVRLP
jgi:hypothetical protein